jgi:peptidoglycan/xylan/chitin deacetylase (PgdA/CDA1 family)
MRKRAAAGIFSFRGASTDPHAHAPRATRSDGRATPRRPPKGVRRIALTFDLCEQPHEVTGYQVDIVDLLRASDIAATFFAEGKWLLTHPARAAQRMSDDRFELANHASEHRNLRLLQGRRLTVEIDGAQRAYATLRAQTRNHACPTPAPNIRRRPGTHGADLARPLSVSFRRLQPRRPPLGQRPRADRCTVGRLRR